MTKINKEKDSWVGLCMWPLIWWLTKVLKQVKRDFTLSILKGKYDRWNVIDLLSRSCSKNSLGDIIVISDSSLGYLTIIPRARMGRMSQ